MSGGLLTPAQTLKATVDTMEQRVTTPLARTFVSGMFAGAFIAFGFMFMVTVLMENSELPLGLARLLGGVVFAGGLTCVIVAGADLFTGSAMSTVLLAERRARITAILRHWAVVYLGNMVGAGLVALAVGMSATVLMGDGAWGEMMVRTAVGKLNHSFGQAFLLGILANFLVCLAVWMATVGTTVVDKVIGLGFPIALFVADAFEHSVANMFGIPAALIIAARDLPQVTDGLAGVDLSGLTVGNYLLANLLPVTLGNMVAASLLVLGMWLWTRPARAAAEATPAQTSGRS